MPTYNLPVLCSIGEFLEHEFDFIVVGGGTAGLVIAARLSENPNAAVGVLEAGTPHIGDPTIMTPAAYTQCFGDPKYDWCHKTVPQAGPSINKIKDMPRGKILGGSSATNFQIYVRGDTVDYDNWEKLGNKGWGFKELLPYFRTSRSTKHSNLPRRMLRALIFHLKLHSIQSTMVVVVRYTPVSAPGDCQ